MAQYIFNASRYINGTLLSSLGWTPETGACDFTVVEIGATGRKYWEMTVGVGNATSYIRHSDSVADVAHELLLLADYTADEVGADFGGLQGAVRSSTSFAFNFYGATVNQSTDANAHSVNAFTPKTVDVPPTTLLSEKAMGLRIKCDGTGTWARAWAADANVVDALENAEPVTWNFVNTAANTGPQKVAINNVDGMTSPQRISLIGVGTGGDAAPYELAEPTVIVPSGLNVTAITETTATLNWT